MREEEIGDETDGEFSLMMMSITRHDHKKDADDEGGGGGSTRSTSNGPRAIYVTSYGRFMWCFCARKKSEDLGEKILSLMSLSLTYESITHSHADATTYMVCGES